jgi:hypothetical protein
MEGGRQELGGLDGNERGVEGCLFYERRQVTSNPATTNIRVTGMDK